MVHVLPYKGQTFARCADCLRPFEERHKRTGQLVKVVSGYPYCAHCLLKRAEDPEFKAWVVKAIKSGKI